MSEVDKIIRAQGYEGIRDQDGWETLELTVHDNHPSIVATNILDRLEETQ